MFKIIVRVFEISLNRVGNPRDTEGLNNGIRFLRGKFLQTLLEADHVLPGALRWILAEFAHGALVTNSFEAPQNR